MAARLRRQISEGTLAAGMPAPSITTLSQQYGHARQTCARALRVLAGEGLVVRIPGLGYHVAQRRCTPEQEEPSTAGPRGAVLRS
jgi:DNA-binding GntR family transcriptional regulator